MIYPQRCSPIRVSPRLASFSTGWSAADPRDPCPSRGNLCFHSAVAGKGGKMCFLQPGRSRLLSKVTRCWLWQFGEDKRGLPSAHPRPGGQPPPLPATTSESARLRRAKSPALTTNVSLSSPSTGSSETPGCSHYHKFQYNFPVGTDSNHHHMKPIRADTVILTGKALRV